MHVVTWTSGMSRGLWLRLEMVWRACLVHLLHGAVQGHVAVLLVRVVKACPRHVPHPDAVVFDGRRVLLEDLGRKRTGGRQKMQACCARSLIAKEPLLNHSKCPVARL